jgi:hypothetical protein
MAIGEDVVRPMSFVDCDGLGFSPLDVRGPTGRFVTRGADYKGVQLL